MAVLAGLWSLTVLIATDAHGFCGAYVGSAEEPITNESSVVVLAQNPSGAVLTMANDYEGAPEEFGLLVPVPAGFDADDVSVVSSSVLDELDGLSGPRVVTYDCSSVMTGFAERDTDQYQERKERSGGCGGGGGEASASADGTSSAPSGGGELDGVVVQSYTSVGEYEIAIVSASEVDGLQRWLDENGFAVSEGSSEVIGEYLEAGSWFLAARVTTEAEVAWLSPLQLTYREPIFTLPLRLGATASSGVQDLILYVIGSVEEGRAAISNYPEALVEDECMTRQEGDWYGELIDRALAPDSSLIAGEASWALEFGWVVEPEGPPVKCDPCPPPQPTPLIDLGWKGDKDEAYLSRLRLRYGAGQIDEDLHLYFTYDSNVSQLRYIAYNRHFENIFPVCIDGWQEDAGFCGQVGFEQPGVSVNEQGELDVTGGCTCASLPVGAGVWGIVLLAGLARRRGSPKAR